MNVLIHRRLRNWQPVQMFAVRNIRVYAEGFSFKHNHIEGSAQKENTLSDHKIESSIGELEDQTFNKSNEKPIYPSMQNENGEVVVRLLYD